MTPALREQDRSGEDVEVLAYGRILRTMQKALLELILLIELLDFAHSHSVAAEGLLHSNISRFCQSIDHEAIEV